MKPNCLYQGFVQLFWCKFVTVMGKTKGCPVFESPVPLSSFVSKTLLSSQKESHFFEVVHSGYYAQLSSEEMRRGICAITRRVEVVSLALGNEYFIRKRCWIWYESFCLSKPLYALHIFVQLSEDGRTALYLMCEKALNNILEQQARVRLNAKMHSWCAINLSDCSLCIVVTCKLVHNVKLSM